MLIEIGQYALILAVATAAIVCVIPALGSKLRHQAMMEVGTVGSVVLFLLVAFSYGVLTYAHVVSDFSVQNVWENSHSLVPLVYKFTGVWSSHEGSMMLWLLILVLFGASVALFGGNLPQTLRANVLSVQSSIAVAFILFIVLTSNPFSRLDPAPIEGQDLNPLLQDPGLAVHPPLLYLGYVGFSICFSFAVAALIDGHINAAWARWVRPWALAAWIFLTIGIVTGSYWAYYELGWGGWWFWDPVENASFIPWLSGTALLHSALVMEKRDALKIWTVLLSILTFSLSLLGTFLVRSGVLTSVHAFASDPSRGVFILAILLLFIGGSLALFAFRAPGLAAGGLFAPISREGALVANNLILTVACASVLTGTLYPLLLETLTGNKISVGPPYFNITFGLLMAPLLLLVPFGPSLAWKRGDLLGATQRLFSVAGVAFILSVCIVYFQNGGPVMAVFGLAAGLFLVFGSAVDLVYRSGVGKVPAATAWRRFIGLPRSAFGTAFAHGGLGITVLGITAVSTFATEQVTVMQPKQMIQAAGKYHLTFNGMHSIDGPNYHDERGHFTIRTGGVTVADTWSAKRVYVAGKVPTTEAGITNFGLSQLYISLGDATAEGGIVVRVWWKPFIVCIWGGGFIMAFGGFLSLTDRRLRIGAPRPSTKTVPAALGRQL